MLAPQQQTVTWPGTGDDPALETIVADQAATISAQAVLIDKYQAALNTAQAGTPHAPVTGTGSATGTNQLTVTGTAGPIVAGSVIAGTGVAVGTTILGQISGTAGTNGVYLTSANLTLTSVALTFTAPPTPSTWPIPGDPATLLLIQQQQSAVLRLQSSLMQSYVDLLNISETPIPP